MKNKVRKLSCICLASILMCFGMIIPAFANDLPAKVTPRYTHCWDYSASFVVTDPDTAQVSVIYNAIKDSFREAKITVQIQKRFLGLFWKTVDIGFTNDEWVAYSTDVNGCFSTSFAVDGKGTYRANVTLEIRGINGTADVIEDTLEYKYS